jgi:hypothetical protein
MENFSSWMGVSSIASGQRGALILQNVKDKKRKVKKLSEKLSFENFETIDGW